MLFVTSKAAPWPKLRRFLHDRIVLPYLQPTLRLRDFRNIHPREAVIVCGCGISAADFARPSSVRTIGVNDFGRKFDPDYLLVIDARRSFPQDRYTHIQNSRARFVFSDHPHRLRYSRLVRFPMRRSPQPNLENPDALYFVDKPVTSPYIGVALAAQMGSPLIGMIGVDFDQHHFFAPSGPHTLTRHLDGIERRFALLTAELSRHGVQLFNLSPHSRLQSVPKMAASDFLRRAEMLTLQTERQADPCPT